MSSLAVERQPNQLLRESKKFGPIRLQVLLTHEDVIIVEQAIVALVINEEQLKLLLLNPSHIPEGCGSICWKINHPRVSNNAVEFRDLIISNVF